MFKKIKKFFLSKPLPAKKGEINYIPVDRFTLIHFMIGTVYGLLDLQFWWVFIFAVVWELIENPLKVYFPQIFPRGTADTFQNAMMDCVAVLSGWFLVRLFA